MTGEPRASRAARTPLERLGPAVVLALAGAAGACITVKTVTVGAKTSLERQLVGEVEPLSDEQLLAASVRAESQIQAGSLADRQAAAVAARRRQLFNRDDIEEAEQQGCVGEGRSAELVVRGCAATKDPAVASLYARLVAEENDDRRAVVDWAVAADSALTPADRPEVVRVYRRILLEAARPGTWVEGDDATWTRR